MKNDKNLILCDNLSLLKTYGIVLGQTYQLVIKSWKKLRIHLNFCDYEFNLIKFSYFAAISGQMSKKSEVTREVFCNEKKLIKKLS